MTPSNVSVNLTFQVRPFCVTLMALSMIARSVADRFEAAARRRVTVKATGEAATCLHPDAARLPLAQTPTGQAGPALDQPRPPGEAR